MEPHALKERAILYMQIWSAGGDKVLEEVAHPELEVTYPHFGQTYQGIDAYREMLRMTYHFFPDLSTNVKRCTPAENTATVEWTYTGTHQNGELFGVEAGGKEVQVSGITILTFKDDKVIREDGIVDNLALAMQIGAM